MTVATKFKDDGAALRAENEYLREAMQQALVILKEYPRPHWRMKGELARAHVMVRKTLEFGLVHAGDGK